MLFMNEYEIEDAVRRYAGHPVLGPAAETLANLANWTNTSSDGWAYWPKPCRAAKSLQVFIMGDDPRTAYYDREREDATVEKYKAALKPIKAFRTRQSADFEIVEVENA